MKNSARTSFKKEIEKILIFYALMPVVLCSVVFLLILALFWHRDLSNAGTETCNTAADSLHYLVTDYSAGTEVFSGTINIDRFRHEPQYAAEISQEIYRFLGKQMVRGEFYLLGNDGSLVYSTAGKNVSVTHLTWNIIRRMEPDEKKATLYMYHAFSGGESTSELQIGAPVMQGNQQYGYVVFTVPAASLQDRMISPQRIPVIVTNQFYRIMLGESFGFGNEMGKLDSDIRLAKGYTRLGGELYYINRRSVLDNSFFVYTIQESSSIFRTILLISFLVVVIAISIMFAIYRSARVVSVNKTRIVDEIVQAFHNAENGDLKSHLHISSADEFAAIGNSYNTMVDSLRSLIERNRKQAQETILSRIKQLESQFNPHFLFNSLENIRFMIRMDPRAADEMIICLSRLLRYSIKNDSELVTLDEEMAYTQDYLQILSYRFGERFHCSIDLPDQLKSTFVPPLLFQPIIENAVKYGLEDKDRIHVQINASVTKGLLLVKISDDGVGMTKERLQQVREGLTNQHNKVNHIGIYNVHQRICLMYGEEYGLRIESKYEKGTTVMLRLPFD